MLLRKETIATEVRRKKSSLELYQLCEELFQIYQDTKTIVLNFGKPDLFITFTCNPLWDEISCSLC